MRALDFFDCHSPLAPILSFDEVLAEPGKDGHPVGDIEAPFTPFEDILAANETASAVRRFVDSLPNQQKDMVLRFFWDDENQAEIARAQGVSGAAISKSMTKVLRQGRRSLSSFRVAKIKAQTV